MLFFSCLLFNTCADNPDRHPAWHTAKMHITCLHTVLQHAQLSLPGSWGHLVSNQTSSTIIWCVRRHSQGNLCGFRLDDGPEGIRRLVRGMSQGQQATPKGGPPHIRGGAERKGGALPVLTVQRCQHCKHASSCPHACARVGWHSGGTVMF